MWSAAGCGMVVRLEGCVVMSRPWKFVVKIVAMVAMVAAVGLAGPAAASPVVSPGTAVPGQVEVVAPVQARSLNGWRSVGGSWYFYVNGVAYKGWLYWGQDWYYMSPDSGAMATDWTYVGSHWYYFGTSGAMYANAWAQGWGGWHYLTASGAEALSQWIQYKGSWYRVDSFGEMVTGLLFLDGAGFFFHPDGRMASSQWVLDVNGYWHYASSGGYLLENQWLSYGGSWYYFHQFNMVTGIFVGDIQMYYFGSNGAMYSSRWVQDASGHWYYAQASGELVGGDWLRYKGAWYYFDTSCQMVTGWQFIDGTWYLFDANGVLVS